MSYNGNCLYSFLYYHLLNGCYNNSCSLEVDQRENWFHRWQVLWWYTDSLWSGIQVVSKVGIRWQNRNFIHRKFDFFSHHSCCLLDTWISGIVLLALSLLSVCFSCQDLPLSFFFLACPSQIMREILLILHTKISMLTQQGHNLPLLIITIINKTVFWMNFISFK